MKSVAILIPAYNEGPRIGDVLEVVCRFEREKRIVVIDDGSKDDTYDVAKKFPVDVLAIKTRVRGCSATGIDFVEICRFGFDTFDKFKSWAYGSTVGPIRKNAEIGMTVGMFKSGGKKNVDLAQKYFSVLNGQEGLGFYKKPS